MFEDTDLIYPLVPTTVPYNDFLRGYPESKASSGVVELLGRVLRELCWLPSHGTKPRAAPPGF